LFGLKITISLDVIEMSENLIPYAEAHKHLEVIGAPYPLLFNDQGNLF